MPALPDPERPRRPALRAVGDPPARFQGAPQPGSLPGPGSAHSAASVPHTRPTDRPTDRPAVGPIRSAVPPAADPAAPGGSAGSIGSAGSTGATVDGRPGTARGADLARDALAAARDANAAKRRAAGRNPMLRTGGSLAGRRRRRWSGSGPDSRDPQPLAATIRSWVAQAGAAADLTRAQIFGRWSQVVGEDVAEHCAPVSLTDGELVVQAESTAWATQIRMLAPQLVRRINTELGDRVVTRIRARGPSGPSWRFGPRHVPGRGPRDTYG